MGKKQIGEITHFYPKINVAVVKLSGKLKKGDKIAIEGKNNFEQTVESMQVEHKDIEEAKPKDDIGMKMDQEVREGDKVFKV